MIGTEGFTAAQQELVAAFRGPTDTPVLVSHIARTIDELELSMRGVRRDEYHAEAFGARRAATVVVEAAQRAGLEVLELPPITAPPIRTAAEIAEADADLDEHLAADVEAARVAKLRAGGKAAVAESRRKWDRRRKNRRGRR